MSLRALLLAEPVDRAWCEQPQLPMAHRQPPWAHRRSQRLIANLSDLTPRSQRPLDHLRAHPTCLERLLDSFSELSPCPSRLPESLRELRSSALTAWSRHMRALEYLVDDATAGTPA